MNAYEKLLQDAKDSNVNVYDWNLCGNGLDGLYIDGNVAIDTRIKHSNKKACVLAEELGHHHTSHGDILDLSLVANQKQERQARLYAYDKLIGLSGLVNAFAHGCKSRHEVATYLDITDEFLEAAIEEYRSKYGVCITYKNHVIMFIPNLIVGKINV